MAHGLILYSLEAQVFVLTPVSPIQAQDGDNITHYIGTITLAFTH